MKNLKISGSMLVFLGALFWSLNSPIVKFLTVDQMLTTGMRALIAGITLAPFIRVKQLKWNWWMLLYLCSYTALCLCIVLSLSRTSAPIAIGMQYTAIVWLFLVNFIKSKKFDKIGFIPVAVIMTGVVIFMCSGTDATSHEGNMIALLEGIFFAFMTVGSKKSANGNPVGLTAVANLFTGLMMCLFFPKSMLTAFDMNGIEWTMMLILGVIQIGGGYAFYNMGVQKVSPQKASVIALWEMILGPLWVALFLGEYPSMMVMVGFVIVIAGIFLDAKLAKE